MKVKTSAAKLVIRLAMFAISLSVTGCVTTNYMPPPGVPTANVRFREIGEGTFYLYQPPPLPGCYVPSDPLGGEPIGVAGIPFKDDHTIILFSTHRQQPRLGMPIADKYIDQSYFELRMQADHLLTLRVSVPGLDQYDSAFRFTPKSGENYEVTVRPGTPLKVDVYHIDSHDGHYSVERVEDLEIIRRCS
ncbi:hypothetical protein [Burkholderia cepacia]|uniref:hypothetical protein n=1 Tax=Burkholderia cepacia TaxID=292 RepID=UPI00124A0C2E|nr:hypothetical protein [Burkholderia cepacia]POM15322.1 hypothetical protein CSX04_08138 [Burkholderia cepacia]